jgi:hypothetical protein
MKHKIVADHKPAKDRFDRWPRACAKSISSARTRLESVAPFLYRCYGETGLPSPVKSWRAGVVSAMTCRAHRAVVHRETSASRGLCVHDRPGTLRPGGRGDAAVLFEPFVRRGAWPGASATITRCWRETSPGRRRHPQRRARRPISDLISPHRHRPRIVTGADPVALRFQNYVYVEAVHPRHRGCLEPRLCVSRSFAAPAA